MISCTSGSWCRIGFCFLKVMLIAKPATREDHEQQCHGPEGSQERDVSGTADYRGEKEFAWIECVNGCVRQDNEARCPSLQLNSHV